MHRRGHADADADAEADALISRVMSISIASSQKARPRPWAPQALPRDTRSCSCHHPCPVLPKPPKPPTTVLPSVLVVPAPPTFVFSAGGRRASETSAGRGTVDTMDDVLQVSDVPTLSAGPRPDRTCGGTETSSGRGGMADPWEIAHFVASLPRPIRRDQLPRRPSEFGCGLCLSPAGQLRSREIRRLSFLTRRVEGRACGDIQACLWRVIA